MSQLSRYEQETIINFNEAEATAGLYTHNRTLIRKLEQLAQERPGECRLERVSREGDAVDYIIPKARVKIRPTIQLSEEERARRREHARKALYAQETIENSSDQDRSALVESKYTTPSDSPLESAYKPVPQGNVEKPPIRRQEGGQT